MDKPLLKLLENYAEKNVLRMHMPGHKGRSLPFSDKAAKLDITEIPGFDNLHNPEGVLLSSMKLAAKLWGSEKAFFLVNGSTAGILSGVRALIKKGGKVLVARNCHKSVFNALEICGADIEFIVPPYIERWGISGSVRACDIEKSLKKDKDISLVIITSPTYEGVISDLPSICKLCHKYGCRVLVDEAHGAHLKLMGEKNNAVDAGADIVVQSLHKTLSCPTQTAICHVSGDDALKKKLGRQLSIFETSSPSYLFLCAIDEFVRSALKSSDMFKSWKNSLDAFYKEAQKLEKLEIIGSFTDENIFCYDKGKIAVSVKNANISAAELFNILREKYSIEPEMHGENHVLMMTGSGDGEESLKRLSAALIEIDNACKKEKKELCESISFENTLSMKLCDALEDDGDLSEIQRAEGRICAEYVWAYPPGIPIIVPGEVITKAFCESVKNSKLRLISDSGRIPSEIKVVRNK